MAFPRQESRSGLPFPSPRDHPDPGIEPVSPALQILYCRDTREAPSNSSSLVAKSCPTLGNHGLQPARLLCPWDSLSKSTGVGCHFLLQGIFPTQETNPGLLRCRQILYWLSYEGSPLLVIKWIVPSCENACFPTEWMLRCLARRWCGEGCEGGKLFHQGL